MEHSSNFKMNIGVIGSGISGLSTAWLLSKNHKVTIIEKDCRVGGHVNTVDINGTWIDTGFIVYNMANYPNLIELFQHLNIETQQTDMSFGVSINSGDFEYSGGNFIGLFAQKRNLIRPKFWSMIRDILHFYKDAPNLVANDAYKNITLGEFLKKQGYSVSFQHNHLLPMGAAIWSTSVSSMMDYPLTSFVRFCENHGLLKISNRPEWRTVIGGSHNYVKNLIESCNFQLLINSAVSKITREKERVHVELSNGKVFSFDQVVLATHADQSLQMLTDASPLEREVLETFSYKSNEAFLHTDQTLMPKNLKAWSSWNYLSHQKNTSNTACVTYWMNRLQKLNVKANYFVTLNPIHSPQKKSILRRFQYHHPIFNKMAVSSQPKLWDIQGKNRTWFSGSYFGNGFHEDALQSGLLVAEALGGLRRPWTVKDENGRMTLPNNWLEKIKMFRKTP